MILPWLAAWWVIRRARRIAPMIDPNSQDPVSVSFMKMLAHIHQCETRIDTLQDAICKLDPDFCKKHYAPLKISDLDAVDPRLYQQSKA